MYPVRILCHTMGVDPSGYYAWRKEPLSKRDPLDKRLTVQIKQCWLESGGHSGYRNIYQDLVEAKMACGRDRVLRLMQAAGIRAQRGYKAPKGYCSGKPHPVAPICLTVSLMYLRQIGGGSVILRTFTRMKAFCFWR